MGILDKPTLPTWLERFDSLNDLGDEGSELVQRVRNAAQGSGTIETSLIDHWFERVRAASLPDAAAKKFEEAVVAAEAWAKERLTGESVTSQSLWGFSNGLDRVVDAVREGGGSYIRGLGENAVTMSIVSYVYRLDSHHHGGPIMMRDGSPFGIDDNQLARFIERLVTNNIFDTSQTSDIVHMTEYGRQWFAQTLKNNEKPATSDDNSERDDDGKADATGGAAINVKEIEEHLAFIKSDELRGYVLDDLHEINKGYAAGASLSTMILCGSAVEGMVLDIAEQIPGKLHSADKPNWQDSISLPKFVDELATLRLVTDTAKAIAIGIADHRDLVHPNRRRKSKKKIKIDPKAARAMISLVEIVARDLDDSVKSGALADLMK